MTEIKERKLHFDLLRILAAFSVVMLHSAAQFWYSLDINSTEWVIANGYDAVFRFGVPVFVMISGAMFLDKNYTLDLKRLYRNNIFRLILLYVIWSCIYGLFDCRNYDWAQLGVKEVLREMLSGRYHLWFLPMLVGIYMLLPIIRGWVEHASKKDLQYFLVLFFLLQICSETVRVLTVSDEVEYILDLAKVEMACGYIGYFVLGYYLAHVEIGFKLRKLVYALFLPAILINVVLGTILIRRDGIPTTVLYDSYGLFTFIIAVTLFVYTVEKGSRVSFGQKGSRLIRELSADTLGIYVLHLGVMEYLETIGVHSMILPNIVGIPLFAILCFVGCMLVSAIIRRIPLIGRFLG